MLYFIPLHLLSSLILFLFTLCLDLPFALRLHFLCNSRCIAMFYFLLVEVLYQCYFPIFWNFFFNIMGFCSLKLPFLFTNALQGYILHDPRPKCPQRTFYSPPYQSPVCYLCLCKTKLCYHVCYS